jgi:CBS domain-containing protein
LPNVRIIPRTAFTSRLDQPGLDMIVRIMAKGVDPNLVQAGDLIADGLVTAVAREDVYDAIWHMRSKGVRRLPVVDDHNHLLGVLTADDVMALIDRYAQAHPAHFRIQPRVRLG